MTRIMYNTTTINNIISELSTIHTTIQHIRATHQASDHYKDKAESFIASARANLVTLYDLEIVGENQTA